ncbi:hypothetical protein Pan241w_36020 [Gimesia alba]|uniref:Uncharacterized protein n=1 Tax=Gimesia alba TaxID=2527973 RepID=A0A517RI01_9PLAN|nr:hypothetical protein Pan241w_36020 [Gimesia alba]
MEQCSGTVLGMWRPCDGMEFMIRDDEFQASVAALGSPASVYEKWMIHMSGVGGEGSLMRPMQGERLLNCTLFFQQDFQRVFRQGIQQIQKVD